MRSATRKIYSKIIYEWNNRRFKEEYLKNLEKKWQKLKLASPKKKP